MYFASSRYFDDGRNVSLTVAPNGSTTDIHKFALPGPNIDYRGSGKVAGHLGWGANKNAYWMSEHNGDLRIVTFTVRQGCSSNRNDVSGSLNNLPAAAPATLSVLRKSNGSGSTDTANSKSNTSIVVATLPNAQRPAAIGKPGEQIQAVQFIGPRAYVVTFRRTDPLFVLDLTHPARPSVFSRLVLGTSGTRSALHYSSRGINIFEQTGVFCSALPVGGCGIRITRTQGLAHFEVNTQAKTLVTKPC